jgi:WD40 repeat protein
VIVVAANTASPLHTHKFDAGQPIIGVHFLQNTAVFALGEEALLLVSGQGQPQRVAVHSGALLAVGGDAQRVVTGGDDGQVIETRLDGSTRIIATDPKQRWIDRIALGPHGAIAWAAAKTVNVRTGKGARRSLQLASSVGGLAFAPKGLRLAIAGYQRVSLWFANAAAPPETLEWKGSHLDVSFSPDGKYLVTAMQEPTLHAWRLADRKELRMSGYATKVRSMAWTGSGDLATGGAHGLVLWRFQGKDGPIGQTPRMLAPTSSLTRVIACHPTDPVVAVGCADGLVHLVRLADGGELVIRPRGEEGVSALGFSASGRLLAFGTEDGEAGVAELA